MSLALWRLLAFGEAFFEDLVVSEPQVGDVGGAEPKDIFEGPADFAQMKIDADALEEFDERLRAYGFDWPEARTFVIHSMVGEDVNGPGTDTMSVDVKEAPGFGLGRGEPRCHS